MKGEMKWSHLCPGVFQTEPGGRKCGGPHTLPHQWNCELLHWPNRKFSKDSAQALATGYSNRLSLSGSPSNQLYSGKISFL